MDQIDHTQKIRRSLLCGAWQNLAGFEAAHAADTPAFVASETARADKIMAQFRIAVFRVMPLIVIVCAALFIVLHGHVWRASLLTIIVMVTMAMLIDTAANARLEEYREKLLTPKSAERASWETREVGH